MDVASREYLIFHLNTWYYTWYFRPRRMEYTHVWNTTHLGGKWCGNAVKSHPWCGNPSIYREVDEVAPSGRQECAVLECVSWHLTHTKRSATSESSMYVTHQTRQRLMRLSLTEKFWMGTTNKKSFSPCFAGTPLVFRLHTLESPSVNLWIFSEDFRVPSFSRGRYVTK